MIIRHAERPSDDGSVLGVSFSGANDKEDLVVRGWQRAGALVRFFAPLAAFSIGSPILTPKVIFASEAGPGESLRPQHTAAPLAQMLKLTLNTTYGVGDEKDLAKAAATAIGPSLISWHHEHVPKIVNHIIGDITTCPQKWPDDRFDLVWVLDRPSVSAAWSFSQIAQLILPGDKAELIPN
jgi:hypothetical protein